MLIRTFVIAASVWGAACLNAQPAPRLNQPGRDWFQRGTTAQVTLTGENLSAVKEVVINGAPGISAAIVSAVAPTVKVESTGGGISNVVPANDKVLAIRLASEASASLTDRELRVVTAHGVSNPITIRLSHLPEIDSDSSNTTFENAQGIVLPAAISGAIGGATESDYFKFQARKGERVIFDVHAYRAGSPLDSSLVILDKDKKELARSEDDAGLDSVIDFVVPEDGHYVAQLRDFRYQGAGNYRYRLIAGALPHAFQSFPFGGQRGMATEVSLDGANLDGANKLLLRLAPDAALGRQEIRAATPRGLSNPLPFDVSDLPQMVETEPNSALDQADIVSLPGAINGRIGQARDYDAFKLRAEKDQRFVFEVQAWRYGSPLDALLTVTDARGNILQRNDDAVDADARLDFRFPQAGEYFVILEDLIGRGGPAYAYRLTARVPQPDFSVVYLPDTPRLRRGGRVPVRVELNKTEGFNEAVRVVAEGLPPGVHAEPLLFAPNGMTAGWIVLTASPEAPLGSFRLKLAATGSANGNRLNREAQALAGDRAAKGGYVTILESAPFSVESATLMAQIEQNQTGAIEVVVDRKGGFAGEIKVSPEGFSAGRDPATRSFEFAPLVLKAGENRGTLNLKTKLDSEIGTRPIFLRAEAEANGHVVAAYSAPVPVATSQVPFMLSTTLKRVVVTALPSGTDSAAAEGVFTVKAERRAGFNGEIVLKLDGVPEGVAATVEKIPAGAGEINVKLVASEKAPAGKELNLTLTGSGVHNDRNYRFQPAAVTLVINAPEPAEAGDQKIATAKP